VSAATRARLAAMLADEPLDLAEANLLISAEASPALEVGAALARVDRLAARAAREGVAPALRDEGFRGDAEDYDDPRNSFLDQVLERRRGLPIALATLTLAVARRAGAPMAGIGMPGHFVVADLAGAEPVYLDPFEGWERRTAADLAAIVRRTSGLDMRADFLEPVGDRAILARTLANLRGSYLRRRRLRDALWTVELGLLLAPGDPALESRAIGLLAGAGRYGEAEERATAFLAAHPGHPEAPAVEARLDAARDMRRRMN
jgi:regulator of sirC expression with transglutaminase-like and TPR domain